jgi:hypothetical protein
VRIFTGDYETSEIKRFYWDDTIDRHIETYKKLLARA